MNLSVGKYCRNGEVQEGVGPCRAAENIVTVNHVEKKNDRKNRCKKKKMKAHFIFVGDLGKLNNFLQLKHKRMTHM